MEPLLPHCSNNVSEMLWHLIKNPLWKSDLCWCILYDCCIWFVGSPRRDTTFELPENQIGLTLGQHLKMQIHIIAYPLPVVEWRFRSADNYTKEKWSSSCNQTNLFKHTASFEIDNITEADFGQYSIFVHNGLGNDLSYLFNVDPQGKNRGQRRYY